MTINWTCAQARRQDSVTGGGAKIIFEGAREVYLCEFGRGRGHEKFIPVWIKRTRWRPKKKVFSSKIFTNSGYRLKILAIFHEFLSEDQEKRFSLQNFYEIRCESTKITKIRAVNTNLGVLGLDLHSNSPEPGNFFGAQFSLGGAQFSFGGHKQSFGGARPRNAPPREAGPACATYRLPRVKTPIFYFCNYP